MEHTLSWVMAEDDKVVASPRGPSYDGDIHARALRLAELIRPGRFHERDVENLADEVEDAGRREREDLVSRLCLGVQHLPKGDCQPERRSASGARTRRERRRQVKDLAGGSPGLGSRLPAPIEGAYRQGRVAALDETERPDDATPEAGPFPWDELMIRPIAWPEP